MNVHWRIRTHGNLGLKTPTTTTRQRGYFVWKCHLFVVLFVCLSTLFVLVLISSQLATCMYLDSMETVSSPCEDLSIVPVKELKATRLEWITVCKEGYNCRGAKQCLFRGFSYAGGPDRTWPRPCVSGLGVILATETERCHNSICWFWPYMRIQTDFWCLKHRPEFATSKAKYYLTWDTKNRIFSVL